MGEIKRFDEDECIEFIRGTLSDEKNTEISDDCILYIIDAIWDWYEKKGHLDINADITDEEEPCIDDLITYVCKQIHRIDEELKDPSDLAFIVKAEIQYEESIEDF